MPLKTFRVEHLEDADASIGSIHHSFTTEQHICPGIRITIFYLYEGQEKKLELVSCGKCGNVLSVIRHPITDFVCKDCS